MYVALSFIKMDRQQAIDLDNPTGMLAQYTDDLFTGIWTFGPL
jgi:hypothetical protein